MREWYGRPRRPNTKTGKINFWEWEFYCLSVQQINFFFSNEMKFNKKLLLFFFFEVRNFYRWRRTCLHAPSVKKRSYALVFTHSGYLKAI